MTTKTPFALFTNDQGRTFTARLLPAGARYGRDNALINDDVLTVEFYDTMYADDGAFQREGFGPLGQFVSRYAASTLLSTDRYGSGAPTGLTLDTGSDAWRIDADTMTRVREWIKAEKAKIIHRVIMKPHYKDAGHWEGNNVVLCTVAQYTYHRRLHFTPVWWTEEYPHTEGPRGALLEQPSVIALHAAGAPPQRLRVEPGDVLDLVLVGEGQSEEDAPVTRVQITDTERYAYPKLEAL